MVKQYKKRPLVVEALQWTGVNFDEMSEFCNVIKDRHGTTITLDTLEGPMMAYAGAYVVKGLVGEYWAVREDVFKGSYDPV